MAKWLAKWLAEGLAVGLAVGLAGGRGDSCRRRQGSSRPKTQLRQESSNFFLTQLFNGGISRIHRRVVEGPSTTARKLQINATINARCHNRSFKDVVPSQHCSCPSSTEVRSHANPEGFGADSVETSTAPQQLGRSHRNGALTVGLGTSFSWGATSGNCERPT